MVNELPVQHDKLNLVDVEGALLWVVLRQGAPRFRR